MVVDDDKIDKIVHKVKNLRTYVHVNYRLSGCPTHLEDELISLDTAMTDLIAESDELSKNIKRVVNV